MKWYGLIVLLVFCFLVVTDAVPLCTHCLVLQWMLSILSVLVWFDKILTKLRIRSTKKYKAEKKIITHFRLQVLFYLKLIRLRHNHATDDSGRVAGRLQQQYILVILPKLVER